MNSSCDLIGNGASQGAAVYLTGSRATLEDHDITDNVAVSGGSVVGIVESSVAVRRVNFRSADDLSGETCVLAVKIDSQSTLAAEECAFDGRFGDTVFHNANPAAGSLVLDSCDFSESSAPMAALSPHSDAEIRNAVVSDLTVANAETVNGSLVLVDRALGCGDPGACGAGECVDSALGVLCECLENGECLSGGGSLALSVGTPPATVTYSPDLVTFDLLVSAAADGAALIIWNLTSQADELDLQALPSSGILPPGENATVTVVGESSQQDVGGILVSRFVATSVGGGGGGSGTSSDSPTTSVEVEVESVFYLCQAFEYAMPAGDADAGDAAVTCEQCGTVPLGAEGLDCQLPGATLASMPVRPGFWRSGRDSLEFHSCLHYEACPGATQVSSSDDYCAEGYEGPCELRVLRSDVVRFTSFVASRVRHPCRAVGLSRLCSVAVAFA